MDILAASKYVPWAEVPQMVEELYAKCASSASELQERIKNLPRDGFIDLHYNPDEDKLFLNVGDWIETEDLDKWLSTLRHHASSVDWDYEVGHPGAEDEEVWIKVSMRPLAARWLLEKRGYSPALNTAAKGLGYLPGFIPGAPSPLAAGITSGLIGAGLGYGGGALLEKLMPERWERGRLRKTLAILGGLAGIVPPALWSARNVSMGWPANSGRLMRGHVEPNRDMPFVPRKLNLPRPVGPPTSPPDAEGPSPWSSHEKLSYYGSRMGGGMDSGLGRYYGPSNTGYSGPWPEINVPEWHKHMQDPRVMQRLQPATWGAANALVAGASAAKGGAKIITPLDIGRIAAGMGTGYLSGAIVGKAIGALTGMPDTAQDKLKSTGMWAGVVANMVPLAFPQ